MSTTTLLRIIYVVALIGGVIMIVAAIVDFVGGIVGWSPWVGLIAGILLVVFGIWRIIKPGPTIRQ